MHFLRNRAGHKLLCLETAEEFSKILSLLGKRRRIQRQNAQVTGDASCGIQLHSGSGQQEPNCQNCEYQTEARVDTYKLKMLEDSCFQL